MTLVRPQDLSFMAGGAVAQRHGVFVRRTSPREDVAEVFARSTTAPRFDENGVVRNAAINVPRLSWRDFDGDGVYEQAVLPIAPQTTNLIEFNVPGGVPSDFELSPITVTNLTAEYYLELDEGDSLNITAPANWTEDDWAFKGWLRSSWPNTDGTKRVAWEANYDGTNYIQIYKDTDGALKCNVVVGGVDNITTLTLAISAGDEIFVGARLNGGSLILYVDTDGDDTLDTDTDASVGGLPAGAWTFYFGADSAGANPWEGGLNIAILNDGSSADPITERFNSGDGEDIQDWLEEYGENVVLYVPKSKEGDEVKALSYASATQLLSGDTTAEGRYDFDGDGDYIDWGDFTDLDGATDAAWLCEVEIDGATDGLLVGRWSGPQNAQRQFIARARADGTARMVIATDLVGTVAFADTVSTKLTVGARALAGWIFDGGGAANADRLKCLIALYDPATRSYGAFVTETLDFAGTTIPATLTTPSSPEDLRAGEATDGTLDLDGKLDDLRISAGVLTVAQMEAQIVNEANPAEWTHWWPLDGDAQDAIGSLNGAVTGATQVADGRHQSGRFERYTKTGRHFYDGVNDWISLGDFTALDGLEKCAFWFAYTPLEDLIGAEEPIFSRRAAPNTVIDIYNNNNKIRAYLSTDGTAVVSATAQTTVLSAGTTYHVWILYDGSAAGADRVKIGIGAFDPTTGIYATPTTQSVSLSGTLPTSLFTAGAAVTTYFGRSLGLNHRMFLDDFRIWLGPNTPTTSELDKLLVYDEVTGIPSTCFLPDHWWTFRGDADDERAHSGTFARNDTGRSYGADGLVRAIAANELRNRCFVEAGDGNKYMVALLEAGFENLNTEDDLQNWATSGSPVVTPNVSDPAGGTDAYTVEDDGVVVAEYIEREFDFTGDGPKGVFFVVRENTHPGSGDQNLNIIDVSGGGAGRVLWGEITSWDAGDPQVEIGNNEGVFLAKFPLFDDYWLLLFQTEPITGANTNNCRIYPAKTAAQTGKIDVFLCGAFDSAFPPYSLLSESEVTTKDEFKVPISGWTPDQGYTLYGKIVNGMLANVGTALVVSEVGDTGSVGSGLALQASPGLDSWRLFTRTTDLGTLGSFIGGANAPTIGDLFEFRISVPASGNIAWGVSKNGGGEATETHDPGDWDANFNALFFALAMNAAAANQGNAGHIAWKVESTAGLSLAAMQALDQPDLFYWHAGMGLSDVDGSVSGALDWYDGRQPEGWTVTDIICDRATDSQEGTYSARVASVAIDATDKLTQTISGMTVGKWLYSRGYGKGTAGRITADANQLDFTSGASLVKDADIEALTATSDAADLFSTTTTVSNLYDALVLAEFAEPAFDTATKGDAIPGIDGLGGPWGIADASSVVASSEGIPLPYDTDFGTTVMKLESGPAGSGTRRYLFGLPGTLNSFAPNTLGGMVVGVYVPSSSEITPAQVTTHAVDDQGSSAGDVATATDRWQWLWATRTWDAGATEAYFELRFADAVSLSGADEVLYMAIPTGVDGTIPLVPIPQIAEGTSVVEEEDFYAAFEIPPGVAGFYVELVAWAPGGLLYIGAAGDSGARVMLEYASDGTLLIFFSDGSSTSQKASASTVSPGSNIKVLGTVTATGVLQITISIDDAAEEESALSSALALPDDWGDLRAYLGSKGGGDHATVEILEAKAVRDSTFTLTEVGAVT